MSHPVNDDLLDLAHQHSEFWVGTIMGALIDHDIEIGDMEQLSEHIKESAKLMFDLQEPDEINTMTDERAEAIYNEKTDVY